LILKHFRVTDRVDTVYGSNPGLTSEADDEGELQVKAFKPSKNGNFSEILRHVFY